MTARGTPLARFFWASLPGYAALVAVHSRAPWLHGASLRENSDPMPYSLILIQTGILLYLFAVWIVALSRWPSPAATGSSSGSGLRRTALMLGAVALLAVPVNSSDVFVYIAFGRIATIHHANPYSHSYREFTDSFSRYAWFAGSMPYGPVFLPVAALAGLLSQWRVLAALASLKLAWFGLYALTLWILKRAEVSSRNIFSFALNPLVVLELLCNAHNDAIIVACLAATVNTSRQGQPFRALSFSALAAMTKLPLAVALGPLAVLAARRRAVRTLISFTVLAAAALLLVFVSFGPGLLQLTNPLGMTNTASLQVQALKLASTERQAGIVRLVFALLYMAFWCWRIAKVRDQTSLVNEIAIVVLGLLVYSDQLQPWHVSWFLVLAAMSSSERLRFLGMGLSLGALSMYALRYSEIASVPALRLLRIALLYALPCAALLAYKMRSDRDAAR
jgi:hypothetical protein